MPRPINQAARRGTSFHAWLESRYGVWSLLGPDDLPGAVDDEGVDLAELQAAFERLPYAALEPVAIEAAVSVRLGGRTVIGRIDAVFRIGDRWEVVDWKTGAADHVSPLQLAIYRLAWAEEQGIDPAFVSGVFVYVSTGRLERFDDLPDRAALTAVLSL
jgi:DNA helicase-2/ATP-dependent DNA helicase PcrA